MRTSTRGAIALVAALSGLAACGSSSSSSSSSSASTGHPPHISLPPGAHADLGPTESRTPGPLARLDTAGMPASTLTPAEIQATVDAHNVWRAKYNETPLVWDDGLGALAQDWSNQMAQSGNFDHRPNNNAGENLFMGSGTTYTPKEVVDSWGSEVAFFHADTNSCDDGQMCGHFTQLVWASTARVGCGRATAGDGSIYWTCNYDPPGNYTGIGPFDAAAQQRALSGQ